MSNIDNHKYATVGVQPISDGSPCGENCRYEPEFEQLEAEFAKQESLSSETVDWSKIVDLSALIIEQKSKDLLVAAYLSYGLLIKEGYSGFSVGIKVLIDLSETHWDCLFPAAKRMRARKTAFKWLSEKVALHLEQNPPKPADSEVVIQLADNWKSLDRLLGDKMGDDAPALNDVSRPLKNFVQSAQAELEKQAKSEPVAEKAEVASPVSEAPAPQAQESAQENTVTPSPVASKPKVSTASKPVSDGPIESDADAKKMLRQIQTLTRDVAAFLSSQKLSDPKVYRLARVASFMVVEIAPPAKDRVTQINPPAPERLKFFETKMANKEYFEVVPELEKTLARSPFWLDGHFYVVQALRAMGGEYNKAIDSVILEVSNFLNRIPELLDLSFANQQPFASDQAKMWFQSEVLVSVDSDSSGSGSGSAETWEVASSEAAKLAASGDTEAATQVMNNGLQSAGSIREKLYWRCALAELLLKIGNPELAMNISEQMIVQSNKNQLSEWEPALLARTYEVLYKSCQKQQKKDKPNEVLDEKAEHAYQQLCWFDPVTALSLKGG